MRPPANLLSSFTCNLKFSIENKNHTRVCQGTVTQNGIPDVAMPDHPGPPADEMNSEL
jgi:hypothetical protein